MTELTCNHGMVKAKVEGSGIEILSDFAVISLALFEECYKDYGKASFVALSHVLEEALSIASGKKSNSSMVKIDMSELKKQVDDLRDNNSEEEGEN